MSLLKDMIFKYKRQVEFERYTLHSKEEFTDILDYLHTIFDGQQIDEAYQLINDRYTFSSNCFSEFIDEIRSSKTLITANMELSTGISSIELHFNTTNTIKNNFRVIVQSNDIENFNKIRQLIYNEMKKYRNEIKRVTLKYVSIIVSILLFISLASSMLDFKFLGSKDFKINSGFFLDIFIIFFIPTFAGLFLYHSTVPILLIKSNRSLLNGIKTYMKHDYKSIIKDVLIAALFLLLGLFIK